MARVSITIDVDEFPGINTHGSRHWWSVHVPEEEAECLIEAIDEIVKKAEKRRLVDDDECASSSVVGVV